MKIVIIGNGIAGTNAARFIRKNSDHEILMISSESEYPYSRTALMYVYMGHMKWEHTKLYEDNFWQKNRISILKDRVIKIEPDHKKIYVQSGNEIRYDKLILATGSKSNFFGWPGQDLNGVQGLYHLQDLESMESRTVDGIQRAVIVGGGLIGIEMAEMFHSRKIPVSFLVREHSFWSNILPAEESEMINRHIRIQGIDLRLGEELKEIKGENKVECVIAKSEQIIDCQFVGITVGVSPNIEFVKNSEIETAIGILVNNYLETNVVDVYAIGDCAELRTPNAGRRNIEAIWYTGRIMGQTVASTICGNKKTYDPGIWFNSAKFFDIEYQVYGYVPTKDEKTESLYWEHKNGLHSIRLVYNKETEKILGFNLMGVRYRHEVCEKWIKDETKLEKVIENLSLANFDPEFFNEYESEICHMYNQRFNKILQLKKTRNLDSALQFLNS
ncbi:MAG: NAD(P)/FAD-dependent oxidoreductase [Saprospiraceae bacterium]|nr:NAD(P)/FAD-dependent oxidoreductase [Saprospiraceae bacterium]